jgi:hypothetical protein
VGAPISSACRLTLSAPGSRLASRSFLATIPSDGTGATLNASTVPSSARSSRSAPPRTPSGAPTRRLPSSGNASRRWPWPAASAGYPPSSGTCGARSPASAPTRPRPRACGPSSCAIASPLSRTSSRMPRPSGPLSLKAARRVTGRGPTSAPATGSATRPVGPPSSAPTARPLTVRSDVMPQVTNRVPYREVEQHLVTVAPAPRPAPPIFARCSRAVGRCRAALGGPSPLGGCG